MTNIVDLSSLKLSWHKNRYVMSVKLRDELRRIQFSSEVYFKLNPGAPFDSIFAGDWNHYTPNECDSSYSCAKCCGADCASMNDDEGICSGRVELVYYDLENGTATHACQAHQHIWEFLL